MRHYSDVVQDRNGNAIAGATVTVKNYPALTTATVYGSNVVGASVNPLTTDSSGRFEFWAPNGRYALTVSKSGITTTTQNDVQIFDLPVSVAEYGAVGDGSTDDTAAFQAAATAIRAAGGGTLALEAGKNYKVFTGVVSQTFLVDVSACTNVDVQGNGATITSALVNTAQSVVVIYGAPVTGLRVSNLKFVGGNTTLTPNTGEKFVVFSGGAKNIHVSNVYVTNCNAGVQCLDNSTKQLGITLLNGYFDKCFYPLTLYGSYDVLARGFVTRNCGRSYFPVAPGANHDIALDSQSGYTSSDCLIKVYADSTKSVDDNTLSNIRLDYFSSGRTVGAASQGDAIIQMDFEQVSGVSAAGHFENIAISFNIDGAGASQPGNIFGMDKYTSAGAADATGRSHTVRNVTISGVARNWDNSSGGYGISICNTAKGDVWTGDTVTGLAVRDVAILGVPSVSALSVNAQAAVSTAPFLTLENFYADGGISYVNATGARISENNVKSSGLDATNVLTTSWTPTDGSGAGLTFSGVSATYSKRGRQVMINLILTYPVTADGTAASISGIPFAFLASGWTSINTNSATAKGIAFSGTNMAFGTGTGSAVTNAQMSGAFVVATFSYLMA